MQQRADRGEDTAPAPIDGVGTIGASLREVVYGGNDGIVTTFAVVAGFAGAAAEGAGPVGAVAVLLFGLANLLADATSMGLGAFLSARSQRDIYHRVHGAVGRMIAADPEGQRQGYAARLAARGIAEDTARAVAAATARDPGLLAEALVREAMALSGPDGDRPVRDALMTFASFLCFGAVPLVPYFLMPPSETTFLVAVGATFSALVALGLLRWKVTIEPMARCVGETVLVGGICAAVAYGVGLAFRV
ncbi:VIT1/CCC1 transporter family protein [Paralimibaculum aggregatum]|uniref:VIT1/CCC1 transporter family protein n=1 Tax=Paralimibaculum aggregatum TaxID=3036245 RepID=A0ABQ6LIZ9_9RHOB|nr:VIT1/CCC1 transporter family protein [Limibaculum sp. NKW23]GMG81637.1 VIT1/CCC1 transporter family protein [Limibaculum sp. NKW23]